ncbi:hypothetical protein [Devosia sp. 2618]|uniref:hypothetical protein n=1 Tax=Devosia sp. 2618 TaxID=3156454 RepID=UPI0033960FBD
MASSRKNDDRILDKDERELVAETRHPNLSELDSEGLRSLARRLRERRDRAQGLDRRQRRSQRGAQSDTGPNDSGNRQKAAALTSAIARLNKEYARRADA